MTTRRINGWICVEDNYGKEYCLLNNTLTFDDAVDMCETNGYNLLKVENNHEHHFVEYMLNNNTKRAAWLGVNVTRPGEKFSFIGSDTDIQYQIRQVHDNEFQCMLLNFESSPIEAIARECAYVRGDAAFICHSTEPCKHASFNSFTWKDSECMTAMAMPVSWFTAHYYCEVTGGQLLQLNVSDEVSWKLIFDEINSLRRQGFFPGKFIWNSAQNYKMTWTDYSPIRQYFWDMWGSEPDNGRGNCVRLSMNTETNKPTPFDWRMTECDRQNTVICTRKLSVPRPTPTRQNERNCTTQSSVIMSTNKNVAGVVAGLVILAVLQFIFLSTTLILFICMLRRHHTASKGEENNTEPSSVVMESQLGNIVTPQ